MDVLKKTLDRSSSQGSFVLKLTHRVRRHNLETWIGILQQLLNHLEERFDEEIECLGMAGHQQQVHRFHRNFDESKINFNSEGAVGDFTFKPTYIAFD